MSHLGYPYFQFLLSSKEYLPLLASSKEWDTVCAMLQPTVYDIKELSRQLFSVIFIYFY